MKKNILSLALLVGFAFGSDQVVERYSHLANKKILLMYAVRTREATSGAFGSSVYRMQLYKLLLAAGVKVTMLVGNQAFQKECDHLGLPYHKCCFVGSQGNMSRCHELTCLVNEVLRVCRLEHVDLIHCNVGDDLELEVAKIVQQHYPVKIVVTLHHDTIPSRSLLKGVDGIIGVSPGIERSLKTNNVAGSLGIKQITWVAPLFDQTRFTSFVPTDDKKTFFRKNFAIDILDCPIICMVGIFYKNAQWKNHEVLVNAIETIIKKHGRMVQVVFAGDGPRKAYIQHLVAQLGLENIIHFLGYTKLIPELLYHSDIKVLTSNQEGFGIALMEGALMQKPLIGTRGTGMENIIEHDVTGLLFEKGDVNDLACQIERVLDDHRLATTLGIHAYGRMLERYGTDRCLEKILIIYEKVFKGCA